MDIQSYLVEVILKAVNQASPEVKAAAKDFEQLSVAEEQLKASSDSLRTSIDSVEASIGKADKAATSYNKTLKDGTATSKAFADQIAKAAQTVLGFAKGLDGASMAVDKLSSRAIAATKSIEGLDKAAEGIGSAFTAGVKVADVQLDRLLAKIAQVTLAADAMNKKVSQGPALHHPFGTSSMLGQATDLAGMKAQSDLLKASGGGGLGGHMPGQQSTPFSVASLGQILALNQGRNPLLAGGLTSQALMTDLDMQKLSQSIGQAVATAMSQHAGASMARDVESALSGGNGSMGGSGRGGGGFLSNFLANRNSSLASRTILTPWRGIQTFGGGEGSPFSLANLFRGDNGRGGWFGLPGFGSIGSLGGLGAEHFLLTGLGLLGSATMGAVGGGAMASAAATRMGIIGGGDMLVGHTVTQHTETLYQMLQQQQQTIALYGAHSAQALAIQKQLNFQMSEYGTVAGRAELHTARLAGNLRDYFIQATQGAQVQRSQFYNGLIGVGHSYVPDIAAAAQRNFSLTNTAIRPLESWLTGSQGHSIFADFENQTAKSIPTTIHAISMALEDFLRLMDSIDKVMASHHPTFMEKLDAFFTKKNAEGVASYTREAHKLVADFERWKNLVDILVKDLHVLFKADAGTANSIVAMLTQMLDKLHTWETSIQGQSQLHTIFSVHRQEIQQMLKIFEDLTKGYGAFYLNTAPGVVNAFTLIGKAIGGVLSMIEKVPGGGFVIGLGIILSRLRLISPLLKGLTGGLGLLGRHIPGVSNLMNRFGGGSAAGGSEITSAMEAGGTAAGETIQTAMTEGGAAAAEEIRAAMATGAGAGAAGAGAGAAEGAGAGAAAGAAEGAGGGGALATAVKFGSRFLRTAEPLAIGYGVYKASQATFNPAIHALFDSGPHTIPQAVQKYGPPLTGETERDYLTKLFGVAPPANFNSNWSSQQYVNAMVSEGYTGFRGMGSQIAALFAYLNSRGHFGHHGFAPGSATGSFQHPAAGGRQITVAEGGYPEVILTTDPKYANRSRGLLAQYLRAAPFVFGGRYAAGGIVSPFSPTLSSTISSLASPQLYINMMNYDLALAMGTPHLTRPISQGALGHQNLGDQITSTSALGTTASYSYPNAPSSLSGGAAGMLTSGQRRFAAQLSSDTGLNPNVVAAWLLAEQSGSAAQYYQSMNFNDWLNIGQTGSGNYSNSDAIWKNPISAANATAAWLEGKNSIPGYGVASGGIQSVLSTANMGAGAQISALQHSGWAASGYPLLGQVYNEVLSAGGSHFATGGWAPPLMDQGGMGHPNLGIQTNPIGLPAPMHFGSMQMGSSISLGLGQLISTVVHITNGMTVTLGRARTSVGRQIGVLNDWTNNLLPQLQTNLSAMSSAMGAQMVNMQMAYRHGITVLSSRGADVVEAAKENFQQLATQYVETTQVVNATHKELVQATADLRKHPHNEMLKKAVDNARAGLSSLQETQANILQQMEQANQAVIQAMVQKAQQVQANRAATIQAQAAIASPAEDVRSQRQLAKSYSDQIDSLNKALSQAKASHETQLAAQIEQQIEEATASMIQAKTAAIQAAVTNATTKQSLTASAISVRQAIATPQNDVETQKALAASYQTEIDALNKQLQSAQSQGQIDIANQIQQQIDQATASMIGARVAAIQAEVTNANNRQQLRASNLQVTSTMISSYGTDLRGYQGGGFLGSLQAQVQNSLANSYQTQIDALNEALTQAQNQGQTDLANQIQQQIDQATVSMVQARVGALQAAIRATAARGNAQLGVLQANSQLVGVYQAAGQFDQAGSYQVNNLLQQNSTIGQMLAEYQQQLNYANSIGDTADAQQLQQTMAQLNVTIQQNDQTIKDTSANMVGALEQVQQEFQQVAVGASSSGIQYLQTYASITGTNQTGNMLQLLQGNAGTLGNQRNSTLGDIATLATQDPAVANAIGGFLPTLMSATGASLFTTIQAMMNSAGVQALDPAELQTLTSLISALMDNATATISNTQQIDQLSGLLTQAQSFSTSAWQNFRSAIFNGYGGLLPQFASAIAGTAGGALMGTPTTGAGKIGLGTYQTVHVNLTSPTEVADPEYLGERIVWHMQTAS